MFFLVIFKTRHLDGNTLNILEGGAVSIKTNIKNVAVFYWCGKINLMILTEKMFVWRDRQ